MMDARENLRNLSPRGWTLFAAGTFGLLGTILSVLILWFGADLNLLAVSSSNWSKGPPYAISAWVSGASVGGLAWWVLVEDSRNASDIRGLAAGSVAMFGTHFLTFALPAVWGIATGWSDPLLSSFTGSTAHSASLLSTASLILLYPITLPVAALVGRALARRRQHQIGVRRTIDVRERLQGLSSRAWTLLVASAFGFGGMTTAIVVLWIQFPLFVFGLILGPAAGIAGFTIGGVLWWFAVEVRRSTSGSVGVVVGALTGTVSHFVMWFIVSFSEFTRLLDAYTFRELVRYIVVHVGYLGSISILLTGIITIPTGAYIGDRLVQLRRASIEETSSGGDDVAEPE